MTTPATAEARISQPALIAVCGAGFAFSANYTNHAPMIGALRAEFGFDQTAAGLLTTGIFLTHALMQIPGGRLADRLGATRVMLAALAWVAAGNVAIAFAGSYAALLFWKIVTGFGTGTCFAAGARYTVGAFQGRSVHVAQGLYGGAVLLGSGFVIFAVPQLLDAAGWRGAFAACGGVAALALANWAVLAARVGPAAHPAGTFAGMLMNPQLWLLGVVQMASFGLVVVVGAWITTLLRTGFEMPLKTAGLVGSLVLLLGIASRPAGGWMLRRVRVTRLIRGSLLLNALGCLALAWGGSRAVTLLAILMLGAGCGLPYAGVFNRAAALFPGRAGAAMGLVNMVGITMILAGAPLVGYLADWTGQFRSSFIALAAFSAAACAASLAVKEE